MRELRFQRFAISAPAAGIQFDRFASEVRADDYDAVLITGGARNLHGLRT